MIADFKTTFSGFSQVRFPRRKTRRFPFANFRLDALKRRRGLGGTKRVQSIARWRSANRFPAGLRTIDLRFEAKDNFRAFGPVAQRLEQATHNRLVLGSNPSGPTITLSPVAGDVWCAAASTSGKQKLRGVEFREGVHVFPHLIAADHDQRPLSAFTLGVRYFHELRFPFC